VEPTPCCAIGSTSAKGAWLPRPPGETAEALRVLNEIELSIIFDDADAAQRAFLGTGPAALTILTSGERVVAQAVRDALAPFIGTDGLKAARPAKSPAPPPRR
jgi:hypothetical protein